MLSAAELAPQAAITAMPTQAQWSGTWRKKSHAISAANAICT